MQECVGCRTICCIIAYNAPKRKTLCPCVSCIIKVNCLVACNEYRESFKMLFRIDMSLNHKSRHVYDDYYKPIDRKPRLLLHMYDFNEGEKSSGWAPHNPMVFLPNFYQERNSR